MGTDELPEDEDFRRAYEAALEQYGGNRDVSGIDIGFRSDPGPSGDLIAVRIHARRTVEIPVLHHGVAQIQERIPGIPLEILRADYVPQQDSSSPRLVRRDPIQPGISVGHPRATAGTLGVIVTDRSDQRQLAVLSNWHVLAGPKGRAGDPVIQPGPEDGGTAEAAFAKLERFILNEDGDAAIALLDGARRIVKEQFESNVKLSTFRVVRLGDVVEKSGSTTAVTRGRVDGIGRYFLTFDGAGRVGIDGFRIVTIRPGNPDNEEISSGGDSGSCWYVPDTKEGVGLHFGGESDPSPRKEHAVACHLPRVFKALDIDLSVD